MSKRFMCGNVFTEMVQASAVLLEREIETVNALNVFPVPDGDTGTNMNMTLASGTEQLLKLQEPSIGDAAKSFARGLLMGARGNSGVILSQLFRGFSIRAEGLRELDAVQFAEALKQGVDTAYQAVVKPVEGTILTVAKEAANYAVRAAKQTNDLVELMAGIVTQAKHTLAETPNMLPILKQVGVVDSGGQGLVFIYEGFLQALKGEKLTWSPKSEAGSVLNALPALDSAQAQIQTEDIEHFYDMEFFITLFAEQRFRFQEESLRNGLSDIGDSVLVIADDDQVKVHVHSKSPGDVLNLVTSLGELSRIHIENMRNQHRQVIESEVKPEYKEYGLLAVAVGDGMIDIFKSLGVDEVLSGGQTMNPSTEEIVAAAQKIHAKTIIILPNNSNIVLSARQAIEMIEDGQIVVIPTKSVTQGIASVLVFDPSVDVEQNEAAMNQAMAAVKSGHVTFAIRDSLIDGVQIKENDYLGMFESRIVVSGNDLLSSCQSLLAEMIDPDQDEIVTIYTGEQADSDLTESLIEQIETAYPDLEIELHRGGQPLYYYMFSVE